MTSIWTGPLDMRLRGFIALNYSAAQISKAIAQEFGLTVTRNAVIGRAHRIGLSLNGGPKVPRPKRVYKQRLNRPKGNWAKKPEFMADPIVPVRDDDIPQAQRKTLWQLTESDCRWPCEDRGTPGFFFCASPALDWSSYCAVHHRRAHNKAVEVRPKVIGTGFHTRTKEGKAA